MMDAASDDPIEMIATLARGMMAERRRRFLDAACGGDANLRAEVEARLGDASQNDGTVEQPAAALADQLVNPELDSSRVRRRRRRHPRRVAGEHYCSPAPSERHVNLSVYAAQASPKTPRGTRWGASAPPARYWSGADGRNTPETAPAGKLP